MLLYKIFIFAIFAKSAFAGLCDTEPRLWICEGGTAKFNSKLYKEKFQFTIPGIPPGFAPTFDKNEMIKRVDFEAKGRFDISNIVGPDIEEIEISGANLTLRNLCPFLETKFNLPKLEKVTLENVEIFGFQNNQDCGNDDLVVALESKDNPPNYVEIEIKKATINVVNAVDKYLFLDRLYHLKSLKFDEVNFNGISHIAAFRNADAGKKIFAKNVIFNSNPDCKCETKPDSNQIECCGSLNQNEHNGGQRFVLSFSMIISVVVFLMKPL